MAPDQIDDDLHKAWRDQLIELCKSYRFASDFDDVRDVYRELVSHIDNQPASMTELTDPELRAGIVLQLAEIDRLKTHLRDEGDRIAELSQDLQTTADALAGAHAENVRLMDDLREWKMRALDAEDERDSLLEMNGKQASTIVALRDAMKTIEPYVRDKTVTGRKPLQPGIYTLHIGQIVRDALESA